MLRSSGMSSHCVVPYWTNQRQEQVKEDLQEEEGNITSNHVQSHQSISSSTHNITTSTITNVVPISNYEEQQVKELTWENGEIAMHGLLPQSPSKPIWAQTGGTLESVVHQATQGPNNKVTWTSDSAGVKWADGEPISRPNKKRAESDNSVAQHSMLSFESPPSFKNNKPNHHLTSHGCLENQEEERDTRDEPGRSNCTKRSRVASVHNQSERRRRDRINQKMKALQKLVPNSSKSDKASMLDEVIEYLKQLQAQVQVMTNMRAATPHMMMQMSLLAAAQMRIGMGMRMGMVDTTKLVPSPFMMVPPTHSQQPKLAEASSSSPSLPLPDPYSALLAQSMNMEFYNNMAALYAQQLTQPMQSTPSRPTQLQAE